MEPRISDTGVLTTVQLALMAVLAIVVILGVLWGIRQKRTRDAAREAERTRVEEEGAPDGGAPDAALLDRPAALPAAEPQPAPPPQPVSLVAPPPPVAPLLPPVSDDVVPGTPEPLPLSDEPIAAAMPAEGSSAAISNDLATPPPPSLADGPVTQLKGLGPKVAGLLAERGITTVGQIAALDEAQAQALDAQLGAFTGRLTRDRWVEQARLLSVGDIAGFEAVFGRL